MKADRARGRVTLTPSDDPERWVRASLASGQPVTPFHSYPWLVLAARMTGVSFTPFIARSAGTDIGIVPYLSRSVGPISIVNRLPFPYVGPLVPPGLLSATLTATGRVAIRRRAVIQQFQFPPDALLDAVDLAASGFDVTQESTYTIDTALDVDQLWGALGKTSRKKIRQTRRSGLRVTTTTHGQETLARVLGAIFHRGGLGQAYPAHFPPDIADLNTGGLEAHWTVVSRDGEDIGSLVTLLFGNAAMAWVGGVHPDHQATNANVLLYWEMIEWASERGAKTLDLVGNPRTGIDRFKRQFGGVRRPYTVITKSAPGWRHAQRLAVRVRQAGRPAHPGPS